MHAPSRCSRRLKEIQMPTIDRETSCLLMIDFQSRLMPAIEDGAAVLANARRLIDAAELMQLPIVFTSRMQKAWVQRYLDYAPMPPCWLIR